MNPMLLQQALRSVCTDQQWVTLCFGESCPAIIPLLSESLYPAYSTFYLVFALRVLRNVLLCQKSHDVSFMREFHAVHEYLSRIHPFLLISFSESELGNMLLVDCNCIHLTISCGQLSCGIAFAGPVTRF